MTEDRVLPSPSTLGRHMVVGGRVQGVGFRPFVYRLAQREGLTGWVRNLSGQVDILTQGSRPALQRFTEALLREAPPSARPRMITSVDTDAALVSGFSILPSDAAAPPEVHVPPDQFTCDDCLRELIDPSDRRQGYPFINCTQCGPRYTLVTTLPYDRANTTMAGFPLCPACAEEYADPMNRRFHAEPVACAACGPRLWFVDVRLGHAGPNEASRLPLSSMVGNGLSMIADGAPLPGVAVSNVLSATGTMGSLQQPDALDAALAALGDGAVLAIKGIGGYHLVCDAFKTDAIATLRQRKHRPHKPLALMLPPDDGLATLRRLADPTAAETAMLTDPMRPIVLVRKRPGSALPDSLAPGMNELGVMLPYSPLHHLLLRRYGRPLVATSANLSGEPVLTDNHEAEARLGQIADGFLHHDRPIARAADDPVYRVIAGRSRPIRVGRGNAPVEITLPFALQSPMLALGGQMKATVTLGWGRRAVVSPHLGDMDTPRGIVVLRQVAADLQALYGVHAETVCCDAHPGYASSRLARRWGLPVRSVFHHAAHASALTAEYPSNDDWIVFTWDGAGLGSDGSLWGGEALVGAPGRWQRRASFRPFPLLGGDKAARQPWRCALALAWESGQNWTPLDHDIGLLRQAWQRGINCPTSSSVGRLFDAAAAMLGLVDTASFEGQAAVYLEAAADQTRHGSIGETGSAPVILTDPPGANGAHGPGFGEREGGAQPGCDKTDSVHLRAPHGGDACAPAPGQHAGRAIPLPLTLDTAGLWRTDWAPMLPALRATDVNASTRALCFHNTLATALLAQATALRAETGITRLGLTGGVFQNRLLTETVIDLAHRSGFTVVLPETLPCNDAGLSFGQLIEAAACP